jgi:hypothetical protein
MSFSIERTEIHYLLFNDDDFYPFLKKKNKMNFDVLSNIM